VGLGPEEVLGLYDRHARALVGFFARRTRDPQVAVDLLGETFLSAFAARERCRAIDDGRRAAWLYRIAANELSDWARRGARERRALARLGVSRALTDPELERIEQLAGSSELRGVVAAAVEGLSGEQSEAIRLRVLEDRSYAEVADRLGVSEQAARARVSRGLASLRRAIESGRRGAS
jgi:RNA polymerase sigma factor (sigma-70 family)